MADRCRGSILGVQSRNLFLRESPGPASSVGTAPDPSARTNNAQTAARSWRPIAQHVAVNHHRPARCCLPTAAGTSPTTPSPSSSSQVSRESTLVAACTAAEVCQFAAELRLPGTHCEGYDPASLRRAPDTLPSQATRAPARELSEHRGHRRARPRPARDPFSATVTVTYRGRSIEMPGRRTFFSFHYERDVWRATIVRNSGKINAQAAAGWSDASLWERAKIGGDRAIRSLIEDALRGTTVSVVLIGAETSKRRWVDYEIERSCARGNAVIGVRIHHLKDNSGRRDVRGDIPAGLINKGAAIYDYRSATIGKWVELAAIRAGKPCLRHRDNNCLKCKLRIALLG